MKTYLLGTSLIVGCLSVSGSALAQAAPAPAATATPAPATAAVPPPVTTVVAAPTTAASPVTDGAQPPEYGAAPASDSSGTEWAKAPESASELAPRRRTAMTLYNVGQPQAAINELRALVIFCEGGTDRCTRAQAAALYRDVGVVLAGGLNQPDSAVQAFRKAARLEPDAGIDEEYRSRPVMQAYEQARPQPTIATSPDVEDPGPPDESSAAPYSYRALILVEATGRFGSFGAYNVDSGISNSAGQVGAAFTAAVLPGRGKFAMGVRAKGGAYVGDFSPAGYWGMGAVVGAAFPSANKKSGMYVLGGLGVEHLPIVDRAAVNLQALGGAMINGVSLGAGLDIGFGDNFNYFLFGLQIGYGSIL